jgi:hypothetical protein
MTDTALADMRTERLRLFQRANEVGRFSRRNDDPADVEALACRNRAWDLEEEAATVPATDLPGVIDKLRLARDVILQMYTNINTGELDGEEDTHGRLLLSALADLERIAGGGRADTA